MGHINNFKYKEIDRITTLPENLSKIIDDYHKLGYYIEVFPTVWKSVSGYYHTEYVLKILKVEEVEK